MLHEVMKTELTADTRHPQAHIQSARIEAAIPYTKICVIHEDDAIVTAGGCDATQRRHIGEGLPRAHSAPRFVFFS